MTLSLAPEPNERMQTLSVTTGRAGWRDSDVAEGQGTQEIR